MLLQFVLTRYTGLSSHNEIPLSIDSPPASSCPALPPSSYPQPWRTFQLPHLLLVLLTYLLLFTHHL